MAPLATSVLVCLLLSLIHSGESIRCWICSSDANPTCGDPFNVTHHRYLVSDCDRERSHTPYLRTAVCRKLKQRVNGELVIVRSCMWNSERDEDGPCSPTSLHPNTQVEYCSTCTHDECNSGVSLEALGLPIALIAAFHLRR